MRLNKKRRDLELNWNIFCFALAICGSKQHESLFDIRYVTFLRCWNSKWTLVMKFRARSEFSQCDVCQELKDQFLESFLNNFLCFVFMGTKPCI